MDYVVSDKDGFLFGHLELSSENTDYVFNKYEIVLTVKST